MYTVQKYTTDYKKEWDDFIARSKNGTFLFYRDFMEYHSDRFTDFSFLVYKKNKLIALFPANIVDHTIYSHQGLTYGGLVLGGSIGGVKIRNILIVITNFLKKEKIAKLIVKPIPKFYQKRASNEIDYFLYERGGSLYKRDLNLAIDYAMPLNFHKTKRKKFKKAVNHNLVIKQEKNGFSKFWNQVLIPRLKEKHQVLPVHTLSEIELLYTRFPENILQYNIYRDKQILAGITFFTDNNVVKSQYGATTDEGEKLFAFDFLFMTLIEKFKNKGFRYFDMGTVTNGNDGLLKQKEELGCSIYTQDHLELKI